jgi:predicted DNA-binding transcriptional regulator YafY
VKRLLKKISRLRKKIIAEWTPVDPSSQDIVQVVTDAMAAGTQIQIEYEGSGWRLIQPYGWNSSKDGNVLLMCYKDTGEVRSYRLDRVLQVLVDESLLNNQPVSGPLSPDNMYEVTDYKTNPADFEIPTLPNQDEILQISEQEQGMEAPYDKGLDYLTNDYAPIENNPKLKPVDITQEPSEEINNPEEQLEEKPKEEKPIENDNGEEKENK